MWNIPKNFYFLIIAVITLNTCSALYSDKGPVVKLTKDNFKKLVLDSD